jgi:hypothetical protein
MARTAAKKSTARRPRKKAAAPRSAPAASAASTSAPAPGSIDLAGGLRSLLGAVEAEVREVGNLSERIDKLVAELNARRDDQTKRLLALDALRASVSDQTLGAFLDKAIRPRKPRVTEVIPERLTQFR